MSETNGRRDFDNIEKWSLSELSTVATEPIDVWKRDLANAEIARRVAKAQMDAARWMKWSLIVLGAAAVLGALFQAFSWLWPNPLMH